MSSFARLFETMLTKLFISEMQKIAGTIERKIVACGITKLLCDCHEMYMGKYQNYWVLLLEVTEIFAKTISSYRNNFRL